MSKPGTEPEFYVGYLDKMPGTTGRFLKPWVLVGLFLVVIGAFFVGFAQNKMDRGRFEFGVKRWYQGVIQSKPIPMIHTVSRSFILVGDGKFGATVWAEPFHGKQAKIEATLIERDPIAMLEVDRASPPQLLESAEEVKSVLQNESLGEVDLTGELVDSKCYLGVMRPAVGKVHRACAIRCLEGGVPPGLLLRNQRIDASILVFLAEPSGENFKVEPKWAGREIRAQGALELRGGLPVLQIRKLELLQRDDR